MANKENRKSMKRLDTLYQLKLIMDTAIDNDNPIIFSKTVLVHKDKTKFDLYPYFAPYASYPRTIIETMEYTDRLNLFFNKANFTKMVFGNRAKTKKKIQEEANQSDPNVWDQNQEKQQISNFEFTIRMLLCTAFPISNFFSRSYDYFSTNNYTDTWTVKDITKSTIKSVTSFASNKTYFSYLSHNNQIYTVSKVIWINDVFNHPLYSLIVNNYRKLSEDTSYIEEAKDKLLTQILMFVQLVFSKQQTKTMIEMIKENVQKEKDNEKKATSRQIYYRPQINIQQLEKSIISLNSLLTLYQVQTKTIDELIAYIDNLNAKVKEGEGLDTSIMSKKIQFEKPGKEVVEMIGNNLIGLRYLLDVLETTQKNFIKKIIKTYDDIRVLESAIELVNNKEFKNLKIDDETDTVEEKEEKKKLNNTLQQYFPQAIEFFQILNRFSKERVIGNEKWNELVTIGITNKISQSLNSLITCYDENKCKKKENPNEYIAVKLDKLLEKTADVRAEKLIEAYLQVSVVEGQVTLENYKQLKCKYIDSELVHLWDDVRNPTDNWDITYEKRLISLKDSIAKADENIKKSKEPTVKTRAKKQKGGKRTKKRRLI